VEVESKSFSLYATGAVVAAAATTVLAALAFTVPRWGASLGASSSVLFQSFFRERVAPDVPITIKVPAPAPTAGTRPALRAQPMGKGTRRVQ